MKTVVIAPRQSIGKLYGRENQLLRPIVVTPRAPDSVRGWAHVTRVIVLASMLDHPKLPQLLEVVKPACERFVTLAIAGEVKPAQERALDKAWREA